MGSSAKKRKEKKKDFQKAKLKVGKTKPKADNYTDTSFKAKSITLSKQSISVAAPTASAQFSHHVSMLRHKSDSQRQESLAYITNIVASRESDEILPEPPGVLIPKIQPLMLDGSNGVRQQLLKLLKYLKPHEVQPQTEQILLYTRAGMTHLSSEVRLFALDVLEWLLSVAGEDAVSCAGGWVKTLKCFMNLLGWQQSTEVLHKGWSSFQASGVKSSSETKIVAKLLNTLAYLLRTGLGSTSNRAYNNLNQRSDTFPLWNIDIHTIPKRTNPFGHLNLFGQPRDGENDMYDDRLDRQAVFAREFSESIQQGCDKLKPEGGELGRGSAVISKAVADGMRDYEAEST